MAYTHAFTSTECTRYSLLVSRGMSSGRSSSAQRRRRRIAMLDLPHRALAEQTGGLHQQDEDEQDEARRVLEPGGDVPRRELLAQAQQQAAHHTAGARLE